MAKVGRPAKFDRDEALLKATEVFWRHGYDGASIAMLTAAMGINPPSLYAAFGNKEGLYRAALASYGAREGACPVMALETDRPARAAMADFMIGSARRFAAPGRPHGCFAVLSATVCSTEGQTARQAAAEMRTASERAFRTRLARARDEGELPPEADPAMLAAFFATFLQGLALRSADGAPGDELAGDELAGLAELAMSVWPA